MPQYCDFSHPPIMDWTVLPARIAAKAWTDPVFRKNLLSDTTQVIRTMAPNSSASWPLDVEIHVHEDSESVRHLPLPVFKSELAAEALMKGIEDETGSDTTLQWCLPASVIFRSFVDPAYRAQLIADPNAVLSTDGFGVDGVRIRVWENTLTSQHLPLPVNPWKEEGLGYDALVDRYVSRMIETS